MGWRIRQRRKCYRMKMKDKLKQNNVRGFWRGLKSISERARLSGGRRPRMGK